MSKLCPYICLPELLYSGKLPKLSGLLTGDRYQELPGKLKATSINENVLILGNRKICEEKQCSTHSGAGCATIMLLSIGQKCKTSDTTLSKIQEDRDWKWQEK